MKKLDELFWTGEGYRLFPSSEVSPHATASMLCSSIGQRVYRTAAYEYLKKQIESCEIRRRMTPYFAAFVAYALEKESMVEMKEFIKSYYSPLVNNYGTIQERGNDDDSLAHGWSIGIAPLLLERMG